MPQNQDSAAIYCRVSTIDQSCERQERDLTAFAGRAGYDVTGIFKETGSGAKLDRAFAMGALNDQPPQHAARAGKLEGFRHRHGAGAQYADAAASKGPDCVAHLSV